MRMAFLLVWALANSAGLALAGPAVAEAVQDLLADVARVRCQAANALGRAGDRAAVPALVKALADPEAAVRREAARALATLRDPQAGAALVQALHDTDPNVRFYAAYALGELRLKDTADALVDVLVRDTDTLVRDQAAWALRELRTPALAGPLLAALRGTAADVGRIGWVLGSLDGPQPAAALLALLGDPAPGIRRRAVLAAGGFGGDVALAGGTTACGDTDPAVRLAAVAVLAHDGTRRATECLREQLLHEPDAAVRQALELVLPAAGPAGGLQAHWSFDDRHPTSAREVTGHGPAGEIRGCTVIDGKVGAALHFSDGAFVSLGKPDDLPIAQTPLTVMAWIRPAAGTGVVVARGGAFCGFSLYLKDGLPAFGIRRAKDEAADLAVAKTPLPLGAWTHVAGVVDTAAIRLWVDGRLAAETATSGLISTTPGQGMEIGIDEGTSPAEIIAGFSGDIDEVKVFDAALTEAQIRRFASDP